MDVNLRGTVFLTQAVVKAMLSANEVQFPRSIITISSVSSVMTSPERLDYCISKAGLTAFVQGLALRADRQGRLHIPVNLGPANTLQQDLPGSTTRVGRAVVRIRAAR